MWDRRLEEREKELSPGKVVPRECDSSLYYPELMLLKEKMLKVPGFTAKLTEVSNPKKKKKAQNIMGRKAWGELQKLKKRASLGESKGTICVITEVGVLGGAPLGPTDEL